MNIFKVFTLMSVLGGQIESAMRDNVLTIKEMMDIADSTTKELLGVGLDKIGLQVKKEDGKTEIRFIIEK